MNKIKYILIFSAFFIVSDAFAALPIGWKARKSTAKAELREDCQPATESFDLSVNNVRARLLNGGDLWWDRQGEGRYIVPKNGTASGDQVSSLFAGAVWVGGKDPGGSLKIAAQTYGSGDNENDFWPGPLNGTGETTPNICTNWDRFFRVTGAEIDQHLANFEKYGEDYPIDLIPDNVKYWPGVGNKFFNEKYPFKLPEGKNAQNGFGNFWNVGGDEEYQPELGDYPVIEIQGCPKQGNDPQYPDEMIFWIYNDNGGVHGASVGSTPIRMEIQVQAFGYESQDELNNMTFYRYKLINRAVEDIDSCFFAMWVDPDLGCAFDDYIGCDSTESLMYIYNLDEEDGDQGTSCTGGAPTYGTEIPMLGVDYFRGPKSAEGEELGMSSFTYYLNSTEGVEAGMTDPQRDTEFYNYLSGRWKDGTPFTYGARGYQDGSILTDYAFSDAPDDPNGWNMCNVNFGSRDPRTIQATGPLLLKPGAKNELIIGAVWVPDVDHPCPSLEKLLKADVKAQALFDNCFDILDGPDAPDLDFIELDQRFVLLISNSPTSNNNNESYSERGTTIPPGTPNPFYRFQGYKVYQLAGATVENTPDSRNNTSIARLVLQSDIIDSVTTIYNWAESKDPRGGGTTLYSASQMVEGLNEGIINTALITRDAFGGDKLKNHKEYYYTVVAYAHNEYKEFDVESQLGQQVPYVEGRKNVTIYSVIPRPTNFVDLNSIYGQGPEVTKLDGVGVGNNFVKIDDATEQAILDGSFSDNKKITYLGGQSPINVKVVNPLDVVSGDFVLEIYDADMSDDVLDNNTASYRVINKTTQDSFVYSGNFNAVSETLIGKWGISVNIKQLGEAGTATNPNNGAIGADITYDDPNAGRWFTYYRENDIDNYIRTNPREVGYEGIDDDEDFSTGAIDGPFYPFQITNTLSALTGINATPSFIRSEPTMLFLARRQPLQYLNNVDIVFTDNKDLWTRCPVVETGNSTYTDRLGLGTEGEAKHFALRKHVSVGKNDSDGDGKPDPQPELGDGFGYFPGYAIDVETGERLLVFFGENSVFSDIFEYEIFGLDRERDNTGADMMWNPSRQLGLPTPLRLLSGGHWIYVTDIPYSEQAALDFGAEIKGLERLPPAAISRFNKVLQRIQWVSTPTVASELNSYADGLIPAKLKVSMRVDNPYKVYNLTGENNGYPKFEFKLEGYESQPSAEKDDEEGPLAGVSVVPNPYYASSDYERSAFENVVKISNLPPECVVTIYSLDGKFIREFTRNTDYTYNNEVDNPAAPRTFYTPDLEWNVKNNAGIPVSSGVYLIHVKSDKYGEVVRKWFAINRKFDPAIF